MTAFMKQFHPGPKSLALVITPALLWADHHFKLGISDAKVISAAAVSAVYIAVHYFGSKEDEVKA